MTTLVLAFLVRRKEREMKARRSLNANTASRRRWRRRRRWDPFLSLSALMALARYGERQP